MISISPALAVYPDKPVNILLGSAPGGSNDLTARIVANKLSEMWGQPVVILNRPSDSNILAMQLASQATPNGYTIVSVNNNFTITPSQMKLSYDPIKSFTPITLMAILPMVLVVHPSVPVKTLKELVDYVKSKPGELNYGAAGVGDPGGLAMLLLKQKAGMDIVEVRYRGGARVFQAVLMNEIPLTFTSVPNALPYLEHGDLRAVAVSTKYRSTELPEVPTIAEAAGIADFNVAQWQGILAPSGTPKEITKKLHEDFVAALKSSVVQAAFAKQGITTIANTPEEFSAFIRTEIPLWESLLKANNPN
jgi:tripartite-type tricarboxylate transporter receptor subunit TctC